MKAPPEVLGKTQRCVRCGERMTITEDLVSGPRPPAPAKEGVAKASKQEPKSGAAPPPRHSDAPEPIGEMLIARNLITRDQLNEALEVQAERGGKTFQILLSLGHLTRDSLHEFLSRQSGLPSIDIRNYEVPWELCELLPRELIQECLVLPIDKLGKLLTVAMACPLDTATIGKVEELTGLRVKPMLCRLDDLEGVIHDRFRPLTVQTYGASPDAAEEAPTHGWPRSESGVRREEVAARIDAWMALPAAPNTAERVRNAIEDPDSTVRTFAELVANDPCVAAKALSLANLSAYGQPGDVRDVWRAALLLGVDGLCEVVTLAHSVARHAVSFDLRAFAGSAVFCATAARLVAESHTPVSPLVAYTAGLLHDIGRPVLAEGFPEAYAGVDPALSGAELSEAEAGHLGVSHPEAGGLLGETWRWPAELRDAVRWHHDPAQANGSTPLAYAVAIAARMAECHASRDRFSAARLAGAESWLEALGMTPEDAFNIYEEARLGVMARQL